MKKITFFLFTLFSSICSLQLQGQVTIDHNNFAAKASFVDNFYWNGSPPIIPEGGANKVWDYSGIGHENSIPAEQVFHDATNDPDFPNALHYIETTLEFNAFPVPLHAYRQVDEIGYYQMGAKTIESSFSITSISGGADDVLRFPNQVDIFEGPNMFLKFPLTYQSQWSIENETSPTDFELTVTAFGLNQTPGFSKEVLTKNGEVIGYGQVIIPMEDGTPSNPVEVLLIKTFSSRVTNYFLGEAPAPDALLDAFGLVQGGEVISEPVYFFYRVGFSEPILTVFPNSYHYRPEAVPHSGIVITRDNLPREGSFTDIGYFTELDPNFTDAPSQGVNQLWDYSFLTPDSLSSQVYFDAKNDPVFPNALNYTKGDLSFNGFAIPNNEYETIDDDGLYLNGRITEDVSYSITTISGGANDILRFPDRNVSYEGRLDKLQFPLTYGKNWAQSQIESTEFELTVAAFGLNGVPGVNLKTIAEQREVVGEGKLIMPSEDGSPSIPMDVLLLKVETTEIDSLFLGGTPAPTALLNAFGLTQGSVFVRPARYIFYKPDFHSNVLNVNPASGVFFYRPQAAQTSTEPINISHNRVCDVPSEGQSQVTVTITGGTALYQVSGNFNGEIEEGEPFIFILDDNETGYDIIVVDADGNESQVLETGLIPCTKLPVELLSFEGEVQKEGNLLQWTTASELNNQFFSLSFSMDGQNFLPLQKIVGNGTTSTANRYNFMHRNAPTGTTYYQLSQTDLDGTSKNLGVISMQRGESRLLSSIEVYPTATNHQLNVAFEFAGDSESTVLSIYDTMGKIVTSQIIDKSVTSFQLNVSTLFSGNYFLKLNNGSETLTAKFIKF